MKKSKIEIFMMANNNKFPREKLMTIKKRLDELEDDDAIIINAVSYNDPIIILIVSLLFGSLGIDRMLIGDVGLGVLKLLTLGGFGIWTIIDWFVIMGKTRRNNFDKLMKVCK